MRQLQRLRSLDIACYEKETPECCDGPRALGMESTWSSAQPICKQRTMVVTPPAYVVGRVVAEPRMRNRSWSTPSWRPSTSTPCTRNSDQCSASPDSVAAFTCKRTR